MSFHPFSATSQAQLMCSMVWQQQIFVEFPSFITKIQTEWDIQRGAIRISAECTDTPVNRIVCELHGIVSDHIFAFCKWIAFISHSFCIHVSHVMFCFPLNAPSSFRRRWGRAENGPCSLIAEIDAYIFACWAMLALGTRPFWNVMVPQRVTPRRTRRATAEATA